MSDSKGSIETVKQTPHNNVAPGYWWNDRGLRRLNVWLAVLQLGSIVVGYDGSLMNAFWAIDDFIEAMGNPSANIQGLISAAVPLGFVISFLPASYWGDKRGRREPQIFACLCIIVGTLVQTFDYSAWKFFGCRILIGIGGGILVTMGPTHVLELSHPRQAVQQTALFGSNYFVGYIIASWLTFGCLYINSDWDWRLGSLIQGVPSIVQLVLLFFVPESPRWLYSVGREAEGHQILAYYHANGDMQDELVLQQISEIKATLDIAKSTKQCSYLDFFKTKANRKRLFLAVYVGALVQWAGNGLISYYLVDILTAAGVGDSVQQDGINGGIAVWSFFWAIFASLFAQRIGRRRLWLWSISIMLVSYVLLTILTAVFAKTGKTAAGSASIFFLFTFNAGYSLAGTALAYVYVLELLPYNMRTKGLAISNIVDQGAAFFNTYANPIAFDAITYYYYVVYIFVLAVSLVVAYFYFPETANLTLEESAQLLDDPEVVNEFEQAVGTEKVVLDVAAEDHAKETATTQVVPV